VTVHAAFAEGVFAEIVGNRGKKTEHVFFAKLFVVCGRQPAAKYAASGLEFLVKICTKLSMASRQYSEACVSPKVFSKCKSRMRTLGITALARALPTRQDMLLL